MSVFIKKSKLRVKNEDGTSYTGVMNAIAEESTEELIKQIEAKGEEIVEKGKKTLESIPEDYTVLEENVDELKEDIGEILIKSYDNLFDISNNSNKLKTDFNATGGTAYSDTNPIPMITHKIKVTKGIKYGVILPLQPSGIGLDKIFLYDDESELNASSNGILQELISELYGYSFIATNDGYISANLYKADATKINDYNVYIGYVLDGNFHEYGSIGYTYKNKSVLKVNLINPKFIQQNKALNKTDGSTTDAAGWSTSGFIKVKKGKTYGIKKYNYDAFYTYDYCLYDNNIKFVESGGSIGEEALKITCNYDGYVRISIVGDGNLSNCMFRCLDIAQNSNIYTYDTELLKDKYQHNDMCNYNNKVMVSYGDSLVGNNNWQDYVASYFGMYHKNCGVGGSKVHGNYENSMWQDSRINEIPINTTLLLIHAGTNDDNAEMEMGEISEIGSEHDTNTFIGAYQTMLEKMYNRCENAKIIILLPLYNDHENRLEEIRDAIRKVSAVYGYPCYESKKNMGFNKLNKSVFYKDEEVFVHTNEKGGKRMADCIIGFIKQFPIYYE